jgi:hypothetical protein
MQNTHLASKSYGRIPKKSQDRESLIMFNWELQFTVCLRLKSFMKEVHKDQLIPKCSFGVTKSTKKNKEMFVRIFALAS